MLLFVGVIDQPVTVVRFVLGAGRGSGGGVAAGRRVSLIAASAKVRWGRVGGWCRRAAASGRPRASVRVGAGRCRGRGGPGGRQR